MGAYTYCALLFCSVAVLAPLAPSEAVSCLSRRGTAVVEHNTRNSTWPTLFEETWPPTFHGKLGVAGLMTTGSEDRTRGR